MKNPSKCTYHLADSAIPFIRPSVPGEVVGLVATAFRLRSVDHLPVGFIVDRHRAVAQGGRSPNGAIARWRRRNSCCHRVWQRIEVGGIWRARVKTRMRTYRVIPPYSSPPAFITASG